MSMHANRNLLRIMSAASVLGLLSIGAFAQGPSQGTAQPKPAASAVQLTPYTAPDNSATVGVPAGWKVTKGLNAVIQMSGPQGESISLGNGLFVRNGPFQLGHKLTGTVSLSMPFQATLSQKYSMIWQEAAVEAGQGQPQINIISATPIGIGKSVAECGVFLGSMTGPQGGMKFESRFCSLPLDSAGVFKLFWESASIPDKLAAQERATAEAVMASYHISPASLKLLFQPLTPPMPPPGRAGSSAGESSAMYAARMANQTSTCMDLGVIREEPDWKLPSYCH